VTIVQENTLTGEHTYSIFFANKHTKSTYTRSIKKCL
jgi:hypothetical protein